MTNATDRELLLEIRTKIELLCDRQEKTDRRLFGNGQPGELDKLGDRIKTLEMNDARAEGAHLASKRWSAGISAVVSACITWGIELLSHRR